MRAKMSCHDDRVAGPETIWARLEECVSYLSEPFRAAEIVSWFRRHYPDVKEQSLRTHIQWATSNAVAAGFPEREPLLTRVSHGVYVRASSVAADAGEPTELEGAAANDPLDSAAIPGGDWHTEANVQAMVVRHLVTTGWSVLSVANTATKEHGIDIVATRGGETVCVEVKGYPGVKYADPARALETKRTSPSRQAVHWYAQAILAAMRLRTRHPEHRSVIAIPDFPRYRNLHAETQPSLTACGIEVWWIGEDASVT